MKLPIPRGSAESAARTPETGGEPDDAAETDKVDAVDDNPEPALIVGRVALPIGIRANEAQRMFRTFFHDREIVSGPIAQLAHSNEDGLMLVDPEGENIKPAEPGGANL
jgi:hypothetical protein